MKKYIYIHQFSVLFIYINVLVHLYTVCKMYNHSLEHIESAYADSRPLFLLPNLSAQGWYRQGEGIPFWMPFLFRGCGCGGIFVLINMYCICC